MKIRIKANSIRFRLTKSEVSNLATGGYLEEKTIFPDNQFVYALQSSAEAPELSATLAENKITMLIPESFVKDWPQNDIVGLETNMPVFENESLNLLVEKDFVCLDETVEDQSDNYENPKAADKLS